MSKIIFKYIAVSMIFLPLTVFAAIQGGNSGGINGGNDGGIRGGSSNTVVLPNPLGNVDSFEKLIKAILDAAFIIGLPVAVLFIVLAGFRFIWARGNPGQLESAKHNLLYTIVGIGVFFGAWTLAKIIAATIKALGVGS